MTAFPVADYIVHVYKKAEQTDSKDVANTNDDEVREIVVLESKEASAVARKFSGALQTSLRECKYSVTTAMGFDADAVAGKSCISLLELERPMLDNLSGSNFSNLRSLTLHECHLTSGSWTPIFAHLERSMPMLENLSLKNLFGRHMQNLKYAQSRGRALPDATREQEAKDNEQLGKGLVVLLPVWDTNWPPQWTRYSHSNGLAVHTRDFTREDLAKGLVFRPLRKAPGRALGSPELMRWSNSRTQLYAPPR